MTSAVEYKGQVGFVPLKNLFSHGKMDIHIALFVIFIRCQQEEMFFCKILEVLP